MDDVLVKVKKNANYIDEIPLPQYQTSGSAGMDLYSMEGHVILPGTLAMISTGLSLEIPDGVEGQIRSRSGLAAKNRVFVLNSPGTCDADFRGEIRVLLFNAGAETFVVKAGDRIAQMVFNRYVRAGFVVVEQLSDTERGSGGFGSTGVK